MVGLKEKLRLEPETRDKTIKRMRYLRRKIRECKSNTGYLPKKVGALGFDNVMQDKKRLFIYS